MNKRVFSVLAAGAALALVTMVAVGSTTRYLFVEIDADAQGQIQGDVINSQYVGQIEALEYHHQVGVDAKVNQDHALVIWTKPVDRASVNLWRAFRDDERMNLVVFHHVDAGGANEVMTVTLTDATIRAIETYHAEGGAMLYERIRMSYHTMRVDQGNQDHEIIDPHP